MTEDR